MNTMTAGAAGSFDGGAEVLSDVLIVLAFVLGAVVLGSATLRRRTP
jgi:hypothetical protein